MGERVFGPPNYTRIATLAIHENSESPEFGQSKQKASEAMSKINGPLLPSGENKGEGGNEKEAETYRRLENFRDLCLRGWADGGNLRLFG
jgi:hypothetical protein